MTYIYYGLHTHYALHKGALTLAPFIHTVWLPPCLAYGALTPRPFFHYRLKDYHWPLRARQITMTLTLAHNRHSKPVAHPASVITELTLIRHNPNPNSHICPSIQSKIAFNFAFIGLTINK